MLTITRSPVVALRSVHDRLSATSVEAIGGVQDIEAWLKDAGKAFEVAAAQACPDLPKKRRGRSVCMHALRFALMAKPVSCSSHGMKSGAHY